MEVKKIGMKYINKFSVIHTTAKPSREIKYIVVHYTAGVSSKDGSAASLADYYRTMRLPCSTIPISATGTAGTAEVPSTIPMAVRTTANAPMPTA